MLRSKVMAWKASQGANMQLALAYLDRVRSLCEYWENAIRQSSIAKLIAKMDNVLNVG